MKGIYFFIISLICLKLNTSVKLFKDYDSYFKGYAHYVEGLFTNENSNNLLKIDNNQTRSYNQIGIKYSDLLKISNSKNGNDFKNLINNHKDINLESKKKNYHIPPPSLPFKPKILKENNEKAKKLTLENSEKAKLLSDIFKEIK